MRPYRLRAALIGTACAALLAGGAGGIAAASTVASDTHAATGIELSMPYKAKKESITVKANKKSVKVGEKVTLAGKTTNIPKDAKLTVQHQLGKKWTTLHASTKVKRGGGYSTDVKLNKKGTEHLRVAHGKTVSRTVTVTVH